jgi:hypothetical protein
MIGPFAFLAFWGFWPLLLVGWIRRDLGLKGIATFLLLWLAGFLGLRSVFYGMLFSPFVAILDIALVFVVFKGDVRVP